jgi:hypothetical protein
MELMFLFWPVVTHLVNLFTLLGQFAGQRCALLQQKPRKKSACMTSGLTGVLQRTVIVLNDSDGAPTSGPARSWPNNSPATARRSSRCRSTGGCGRVGVIDSTSGMAPRTRLRFVEIAAALAEHFPR